MYIGQLPEPGTPEFGQMAAYRRDILNGTIPSYMSFEEYKARLAPGSISQVAAARKAAIARTPIPPTQGPGVLQLPLQYATEGAQALEDAAKSVLPSGATLLLIGGAVLVGLFFWSRR